MNTGPSCTSSPSASPVRKQRVLDESGGLRFSESQARKNTLAAV
jgi:hypothetical protein